MSDELKALVIEALAGRPCRNRELVDRVRLNSVYSFNQVEDAIYELYTEGRIIIRPDSVMHLHPNSAVQVADEHVIVHLRFGDTEDTGRYVVACGWYPHSRFVNLDHPTWNERTSSSAADVTCHTCLEVVVRLGDAATVRIVELDREAGQ